MKPAKPGAVGPVLLLSATLSLAAAPSLDQVRARGFEVITTGGARVPLAELLPEGRPSVVEFWATWCSPCRKTSPYLAEMSDRHAPPELTVVGLTVEDPGADMDKVNEYASEEGLTFPIAFAPRDLFLFMNDREDVAVPKILVYDAQGNVVEHVEKYSFRTKGRIRDAVKKALAAARAKKPVEEPGP